MINQLSAQLKTILAERLPSLMKQGQELIKKLPPKKSDLEQQIFVSLQHRAFLWVDDIHQGYQTNLANGYFTAAVLARAMMESCTTLLWMERDTTGKTLLCLIKTAEEEALTRHNGLADLQSSSDQLIAANAKQETAKAQAILSALTGLKSQAGLSTVDVHAPSVYERCAKLGDDWLFYYHWLYRDLSEVVHSTLLKTPHSPSLAFRAPGGGAPLICDHTRIVFHSIHFWAIAIVECCRNHPDQNAVAQFRNAVPQLLVDVNRHLEAIQSISPNHTLSVESNRSTSEFSVHVDKAEFLSLGRIFRKSYRKENPVMVTLANGRLRIEFRGGGCEFACASNACLNVEIASKDFSGIITAHNKDEPTGTIELTFRPEFGEFATRLAGAKAKFQL